MVRPRWHDALIVSSIVALLGLGVWALWWDDVRAALGTTPHPDRGSASETSAPRT